VNDTFPEFIRYAQNQKIGKPNNLKVFDSNNYMKQSVKP